MNQRIYCLALAILLSSCASDQLHNDAKKLFADGKSEEGLAKLQEAAKAKPDDFQLRSELEYKRNEVVNELLSKGNAARQSSDFDTAENYYQQVLDIEPGNARALEGTAIIARARQSEKTAARAEDAFKKGDWERSLSNAQTVLDNDPANSEMLKIKEASQSNLTEETQETPTLRSLYRKPVSVDFRDANLKMVFELLSKNTGINFILDKEVRSDLKATLFLKQAALEDAVDLLLSTNQLEKKILNQNTVLIYPGTPGKVKEYQDLIMKGFYLSSADVKQVQSMIKSMLNAKNVNIDERLKLVIIRDTPETVNLAEKIISMLDINEPEVMLEVEILEVQRSKLLDLGIQFPDQLTLTPLASHGTTLTLDDLKHLGAKRLGATITPAVLNAKQQDDLVNILANPKIRARNHEKAKILIGDKVPVITSTSTSTGFVSESVQYVDVGLKLEIEPDIYLNDEIGIKVALEVSSIAKEVRSNNGTLTYQIGTRNASSLLQIKDGETQILAGLINRQDTLTANKVPGFGDLPLIGRLFSNHNSNNQKTEIVLSITPHMIRGIQRPSAAMQGFWTGTDEKLKTRPLTLKPVSVAVEESKLPKGTVVDNGPQLLPHAQPLSQNPIDTNAPATATLAWQGPTKIKVGEQFKVNLIVKSDEGIRSLPVQLGFDPKVLQVIDVTEGDFFKQNGAKTLANSNIDQTGGRVFAGIARTADSEGATGGANLLAVTFKALAASPHSEVRIIAATPVGSGNRTISPVLPTALQLGID